ncbi:MAG: hypothetical protein VX552_00585, partial [Chloroflexota bacterium]|nr:hypothetical protein [Chloroflexota bacterium]
SEGSGLTGMTEAPATFEEALAAIAGEDDVSGNKDANDSTEDLLDLLNLDTEENSNENKPDEIDLSNMLNLEEDSDTEEEKE